MVRCSFSGKEIPQGKGIMYVKSDGKVLYFYDRKCEKNMLKLKRKPQEVSWTEEGKKAKKERMAAMQHAKEEEKTEEKTKPAKKTAKKTSSSKKKN